MTNHQGCRPLTRPLSLSLSETAAPLGLPPFNPLSLSLSLSETAAPLREPALMQTKMCLCSAMRRELCVMECDAVRCAVWCRVVSRLVSSLVHCSTCGMG